MTWFCFEAWWIVTGTVFTITSWCAEQYTQTNDTRSWRILLFIFMWPIALWATWSLARQSNPAPDSPPVKVRITIFITPGDEPRPRAPGHSTAATCDMVDDSPDAVERMLKFCAESVAETFRRLGCKGETNEASPTP